MTFIALSITTKSELTIKNCSLDFLELEKRDLELEKIMNSSLDVICTFNKESQFR